jgi:hypothetical protein
MKGGGAANFEVLSGIRLPVFLAVKCSNCGLLAYDIGVVWAVDISISEVHVPSIFSLYPGMFGRNLTSTSKNARCHNSCTDPVIFCSNSRRSQSELSGTQTRHVPNSGAVPAAIAAAGRQVAVFLHVWLATTLAGPNTYLGK